GELGLRFVDAPRRPGANAELLSLSAVDSFEFEILGCSSHGSCISTRLIYVNMVDMGNPDEQPLGYLMYRIMAALRPAVAAELAPLGLVLAEFVCLRILSMSPGRSNAELARDTNVSPQAMNNVLRGLQDRGIVTRPATVSSGRALPAELT